jgi:catechol 2,3-dioxygenase-like lactoylglutathione lyase family enzyme
MTTLPVSQLRVVLNVDDYPAAVRYYRDTLGLAEAAAFAGPDGAQVVILEAGRATLELANQAQSRFIATVETGGAPSTPVRLAFQVGDAVAATGTLTGAGAHLLAPPARTPWNSLNARLEGPGGVQVTVFQELGAEGAQRETQREPVPRVDSGELDTALAFLSFARHCVLKKADGLSDAQLRRVLVGSGTSILGLIQHLAEAERFWFGYHLIGVDWDADLDRGMAVPADRACAGVLRDYRAAIEDSDRAIRQVGDPDARFAIPVDGNRHTLRWVMAHMTSETARHAGHADILREQIDGTTGR